MIQQQYKEETTNGKKVFMTSSCMKGIRGSEQTFSSKVFPASPPFSMTFPLCRELEIRGQTAKRIKIDIQFFCDGAPAAFHIFKIKPGSPA